MSVEGKEGRKKERTLKTNKSTVLEPRGNIKHGIHFLGG